MLRRLLTGEHVSAYIHVVASNGSLFNTATSRAVINDATRETPSGSVKEPVRPRSRGWQAGPRPVLETQKRLRRRSIGVTR